MPDPPLDLDALRAYCQRDCTTGHEIRAVIDQALVDLPRCLDVIEAWRTLLHRVQDAEDPEEYLSDLDAALARVRGAAERDIQHDGLLAAGATGRETQ